MLIVMIQQKKQKTVLQDYGTITFSNLRYEALRSLLQVSHSAGGDISQSLAIECTRHVWKFLIKKYIWIPHDTSQQHNAWNLHQAILITYVQKQELSKSANLCEGEFE